MHVNVLILVQVGPAVNIALIDSATLVASV